MLATFALILSVFVMNSPRTQHEPGGASPWGLLAQLGSSSWLAYLPAAVRIHLGLSTQMNNSVDNRVAIPGVCPPKGRFRGEEGAGTG